MKILMMMVMSVNGKITRGNDPNIYSWTSKEDQKLFFSAIKKYNLIVMGRKTYEASKSVIKLKKNKLRIILTRNPEKFKSEERKEMLEFTSETPQELVRRVKGKGYREMLLVGGAATNTLFLKNSLVDELFLTVEPMILGLGQSFVTDQALDVKLKLIEIRKLNKQGALNLHYKIQK